MTTSRCLPCRVAIVAFVLPFFGLGRAADASDDRQVENLAAFARVYGYVRFFHPTDEASEVNWDSMGILGAEAVRDAANDSALQTALRSFFAPVGHGLGFLPAGDPVPPSPSSPVSEQPVAYWQHSGVRLSDQSNIYRSVRVLPDRDSMRLFDASPAVPAVIEKRITPHLRLRLPLKVPAAPFDGRTLRNDAAGFDALGKRLAALDLKSLTAEDWRLRVAGVIVTWNVFQHFHPYIDRAGIKWDEALRPALRRALHDRTRDDYYATLSELVAKLEDGHGYVFGRTGAMGGLPIGVARIENQIVVTAVGNDTPFRRGDILVRIDDVPALELLRERERTVSGSPHLRELRALNQFGEGPLDSTAHIELLREGRRELLEVKRARERRGFFFNSIAEFDLPAFAEVRPGIYYVNRHKCDVATLTAKLPLLAAARGVIVDQRVGRGSGPTDREQSIAPHQHIIPHLIDAPVHASPMLVPQVTRPDREGWTYRESTWPVAPKAPRFAGRVVFINVPSVVSYGETCMAMIAHHKLATLVGEPTAGCNGNANYIPLPTGLRIMWTGMEVLKHDRSPFYGTGFVPDYPVPRTIAAVKEGRDEFLDKAIAVIEAAAKGD